MSVLNDTEKRAFREIPRSLFRWTADHLSLILFVFFYIAILVWLVAYTLLLLHQIRTSSVSNPRIEAGPLLERVDAVSRGQEEIHRSIRDLGQKVGAAPAPEVDLKPVTTLLDQISGRVKDQGQEARANTEMVLKILGDQRKVIDQLDVTLHQLAEQQKQLEIKQAELNEKLDGIKAVVRRGNILVPDTEK